MNRALTCVLVALGMLAAARAEEPSGPVSFRREVAPILVAHCLGCHGDDKAEGGLDLSTFAGLKAGGEILPGESIIPGDPDASYLIERIRPDAEPRMPYEQDPLSDEEIAVLERWVKEGAPFDGLSETDTRLTSLVDPLSGLPEIAVRVPASEPVSAVAFAPDGSRLAAGRGADVLLFAADGGDRLSTLSGHDGRITTVLFRPDGQGLIVAGGRPGMFGAIDLWDLRSAKRRTELRGHGDSILDAALAPDGHTLATASYDGTIVLWDLQSGEHVRTLKEHTDAVYDVAFSPDGATLASASGDRTVKLWDVVSGTRRLTLSDATAEQYAVTFGPDGSRLFGAGADTLLRAWRLDGDSGTLAAQAIAHDGAVLRLVVAPGEEVLYSAGEDRRIMAWDLTTLAPRATFPAQPEWPIAVAVAPDGSRLAVGRSDGSLALLAAGDGEEIATPLEAPKPSEHTDPAHDEPPKPELVRDVTLDPPSPKGASRGQAVRVALSGRGVHRALDVVFPEPGITARIVEDGEPAPDRLSVDLEIAPDARPGLHRFTVRTPEGTPGSRSFAVTAYPETALEDPGRPEGGDPLTLPTTILGTIESPGDRDEARFPVEKGQVVVVDVVAKAIGSRLSPVLSVLDPADRVLVEQRGTGRKPDPTFWFRAPEAGLYRLRIGDALLGGSGAHEYRITIGERPLATSVQPLGLAPGESRGVRFDGVNLGGAASARLDVPADAEPGTILPAPLPVEGHPSSSLTTRSVVVAAGLQRVESDEDGTLEIATPGGVTGRIEEPGDIDTFRFEATRGRSLIVEVFGRRLGTEIDPAVEILDENGHPVPRAVLKPVATTNIAFRDHDATGRNIRLTTWGDLMVGDYLLAGRELMRLTELPRNPDDDAVFWGLGVHRTSMGERVAFLETTPEHHPQDQLLQKVEIHPPGTTFPPGGAAPVTLHYRNDDAGSGFDGDCRLTFDPPSDGTYLVRVEDARGFGGEGFGYHLVVREPRPDFALSLSDENPHIRRGGATVLTARIRRLDGFDGPVDVMVEDLPTGITATPTRIEAGLYAADLILMADDGAPEFAPTDWTVTGVAAAAPGASPASEIRHTIDPGGPEGGWITVSGEPNLRILPSTDRVVLRPGGRVTMTLAVERRPPFDGRVPIEVHNLPLGVRVENIGLNGVLVTKEQTGREVSLYAEPWAEPMERPFFAVGQCEEAGTRHGSPPIWLVVEPGEGPRPIAAATADTPG